MGERAGQGGGLHKWTREVLATMSAQASWRKGGQCPQKGWARVREKKGQNLLRLGGGGSSL